MHPDVAMNDNISLVFPYHPVNGNAISALIASIDIDPELSGIQILIPNLKADPTTVLAKIPKNHKVVLAVSLFSVQFATYEKLVASYRRSGITRELLVVAGGPHPSGDPFSTLHAFADIVCIGEGELVIRDLLKNYTDPKNIRGIAFLNKKGLVEKTEKQPIIKLDDFPPFSVKHNLFRPIEITRGCAWKCRFCQIRSRGQPVRHRSPEIVAKYVALTVEKFKERRADIRFISPNALSYGASDGRTLRLDKVVELLKAVREVIGPEGKIYFGSFPSEVRPETLTPESVNILRNYSDSNSIIIGGQSGSEHVLQLSDRGHTPEETKRGAKLLLDAGFKVFVDIIFGLPGEREEDVEQTITHMKELTALGAKIHSHTFLPLVGTPFANKKPGVIADRYKEVLPILQGSGKLKGQHLKQENDAKLLAEQRQAMMREREKRQH